MAFIPQLHSFACYCKFHKIGQLSSEHMFGFDSIFFSPFRCRWYVRFESLLHIIVETKNAENELKYFSRKFKLHNAQLN